MKSILIIKTSAIGDVIQIFPVIEYLHQRYPEAKIDWVVEKACADLLAGHPYVTRVLVIDTQLWRKAWWQKRTRSAFSTFVRKLRNVKYDLLLDLQGNSKSALFTLLSKSKLKVGFGFRSVPEKLNLLVTDRRYESGEQLTIRQRYLSLIQTHFRDRMPFISKGVSLKLPLKEELRLQELLSLLSLQKRPFWMVAFGSKWKNKQLREETLQEFLSLVNERYQPYFFFPFGNKDEEKIAQKLHDLFKENSLVLGQLTLPLWQNVMSHSDLLLSMDSAALHLCATTETPSFSFFGPSSAHIYKPEGKHHGFFHGSCPYHQTFEMRCSLLRTCSTGACLREVRAEELLISFEEWRADLAPKERKRLNVLNNHFSDRII